MRCHKAAWEGECLSSLGSGHPYLQGVVRRALLYVVVLIKLMGGSSWKGMPTFGVSMQGFYRFSKHFQKPYKNAAEIKARITLQDLVSNDHMHNKWNHGIGGENVYLIDGFKADVESEILPMAVTACSWATPERTFRWLVRPPKLRRP